MNPTFLYVDSHPVDELVRKATIVEQSDTDTFSGEHLQEESRRFGDVRDPVGQQLLQGREGIFDRVHTKVKPFADWF